MSAITLVASAAQTASGVGVAVDLTSPRVVAVTLAVTDDSENPIAGGSTGSRPIFRARLEQSSDGASWRPLTDDARGPSFTPGAAHRSETLVLACDRYIRCNWSLSGIGAPSVTFSIAGQAT